MTTTLEQKINRGRKKFIPTDEERAWVQKLAMRGLRVKDIAAVIRDGVSHDTIERHFRRELDLGMAMGNGALADTAFQMAMSGDTTMIIFMLKVRLGWSTTDNSVNIKTENKYAAPKIDVSTLSTSTLQELNKAYGKIEDTTPETD